MTQKLSSGTVTTALDVIIVWKRVKEVQQQLLYICSSTTNFCRSNMAVQTMGHVV